jgi:hypothetical protein
MVGCHVTQDDDVCCPNDSYDGLFPPHIQQHVLTKQLLWLLLMDTLGLGSVHYSTSLCLCLLAWYV